MTDATIRNRFGDEKRARKGDKRVVFCLLEPIDSEQRRELTANFGQIHQDLFCKQEVRPVFKATFGRALL